VAYRHLKGGGLAAWSIRHPIGVVMITLAVVVVGLFAYGRLAVDLLPHIIYPEIRVRVLDPGVPARIMEDRATRQLEEQLAITEDAIAVQSRTSEGSSSVDLSFQYGKDMDVALRDASTRLDRARRFLPDTVEPHIIFKFDPSQLPVADFVVSSSMRGPVELRTWVDDVLANWFLNLPGVAAVEVGGGLVREIHVLPDQGRVAALGLRVQDLIEALQEANRDDPGGRLRMARQELSSRTAGRFTEVAQIAALPVPLPGGSTIPLGELAEVLDTHEDERIRVRLDGVPGIKMSIQKQPTANTVAVVETVTERLAWLREQGMLPPDVRVHKVDDQSIYVRGALSNAAQAVLLGATLAMLVVFLFLGDLRRTLVIGSAIPIAGVVTFLLMDLAGLTINIMTLGGIAVGIGMLVDSTIVMLENVYRHQREGEPGARAGQTAAQEVNSAIVASTSTNLAAVLPFLFISGLVGLIFRELIITISAAIFASMLVALTLVPSLASRIPVREPGRMRRGIDAALGTLQRGYARAVQRLLQSLLLQLGVVVLFLVGLSVAAPVLLNGKQIFLPSMDDGRVVVTVTADPGVALDDMDRSVRAIEALIGAQAEVASVFTSVGGRVFGRTQRETTNSSAMTVLLKPREERRISSEDWIRRLQRELAQAEMPGVIVRMRTAGIRGIRVGRGEDSVSLRVQGPELEVLRGIADDIALRLRDVAGLRNITHTYEELRQELALAIDRERAASLGLTAADVGRALRIGLDGLVVTEFFDADRSYDVRLRLPQADASDLLAIESMLLLVDGRAPVHLGDVAAIRLIESPSEILRDNQRRVVEVTASVASDHALSEVAAAIEERLRELALPAGYTLYDTGAAKALQEGRRLSLILLGLALFLVFVVMAVQYESLRNPFVIMLGVPFASIGVAIGIHATGLPLSMPVWLGMIMLAGIVVNNAIVFVEYIEIGRANRKPPLEAIVEAARLRLRPILMTTLTTVLGLTPLALSLGEGSEMLQPLAVTIVAGLSFSMLVSLLLIPVLYHLIAGRTARGVPATRAAEKP
jgi:multidrug efflux pump subunit AcrB